MVDPSRPTPIVSVVLPTFNGMAYLPTAVESVLAQSCDDWELIIVDDGSTDETQQYVSGVHDARVVSIRLEHSGNPARVRNMGIRHARGRYVAFLDSDDAWLPRKLEIQIPAFASAETCRWSYTAYQRIDNAGAPLDHPPQKPWLPYDGWLVERLLCGDAVVAMPTVVVERELLVEVGGFDEALLYCSDYELWCRLAMRSPVCVHPQPLARVRSHASYTSGNRVAVHQSWAQLYAKIGEIVVDERLRGLCRARRVKHVLIVSRTHSAQQRVSSAFRMLFRAVPYAWRYPEWWLTAARIVVRPLVPGPLLRAYRRLRAPRNPLPRA
jgi:glycosyltransferase involved in cell wall biosynthesis